MIARFLRTQALQMDSLASNPAGTTAGILLRYAVAAFNVK